MVSHMAIPQHKLTLGTTEYENSILLSANVTRLENGFDKATITVARTDIYPGTVTAGTAIQLDVKDYNEANYTTILKGIVRFPVVDISNKKTLTLSCLGSGYGLGQMLVGNEYGTQSINYAKDTIASIFAAIRDTQVNKVFNVAPSGFDYSAVFSEGLEDVISYIEFPYKPAKDCFNDLCDLVTAIKAGTAGPHWIVTTDDTIRLKLVNGTQTKWTKYYGNSQANATLTYGQDYTGTNFETVGPEANYIVYYGVWRRPSNGDSWTNGNMAFGVGDPRRWSLVGLGRAAIDDDAAVYKVGNKSIKLYTTADDNGGTWWAAPPKPSEPWDLKTAFGPSNIPTLNFYARRGAGMSQAVVWLLSSDPDIPDWSDRFEYNFYSEMASADTWYHFSLPMGDYVPEGSGATTPKWSKTGDAKWDHIHGIFFYALCPASTHGQLYIDGLYLGGAHICRAAYNSGISPYSMKLITDDVGKDDTLIADDDSGLMAQLAYAELLRLQKTCLIGSVTTPMIKDVLPGQWFYVQDMNMRAPKIVHTINPPPEGFQTTLCLTDDVTNGRARLRYEDVNRVYGSIRPEWQDRQASNIKAGTVDWRITRLTRDYKPI